MKTKKVWIAWANTDTIEGRGDLYPLAICETESTARRMGKGADVMGSDAHVVSYEAIEHGGRFVAPFYLQPVSKEDATKEKHNAEFDRISLKAISGSITPEDIEVLKRGRL